jgi:hypothetical protein
MGIFGIALHPHRHGAGSPNRANRCAVVLAFAIAALLPAAAWAQSFPNKPIKLIPSKQTGRDRQRLRPMALSALAH